MTITIRSGIPTTYRGTNFRSRLEARWAAMFDLVGWSWTYEPLDADGYIPDFLIHGQHPMFIEVGPCIVRADFDAKHEKADRYPGQLGHDLLVVGVSPLPGLVSNFADALTAGVLGEFWPRHPVSECLSPDRCNHEPGYAWGAAVWGYGARGLGVFHDTQWYEHRPHADGHEEAIYPQDSIEGASGKDHIASLWAEAGNSVQWRAV